MANYFCRKLLEMAKIEMLQRFLLIISKLKGFNRYISGDDLIKSVEENMKLRYGDIAGSSLRTIQRDIKSIEEIFGIIIKYKKGYGYYIAEKEFGITDPEILSAIRWHTLGKVEMSDFEKIIFLADKIEKNTRDEEFRNECMALVTLKNGLTLAMFRCYQETLKSLVDRKLAICHMTISVYNDLLASSKMIEKE